MLLATQGACSFDTTVADVGSNPEGKIDRAVRAADAQTPDVATSDGTRADMAKSDAPNLDAPKPDTPQPDATKPDAAKPDATPDVKRDAAPTCFDGVKNGSETDIDCGGGGGSCSPCANGKSCTNGSDCASGSCDGVCVSFFYNELGSNNGNSVQFATTGGSSLTYKFTSYNGDGTVANTASGTASAAKWDQYTGLGDSYGSYILEVFSPVLPEWVTFTSGGTVYHWHPAPMTGTYSFPVRNNYTCSTCQNLQQLTAIDCFNFSTVNQTLNLTFNKWNNCTVSTIIGPKTRMLKVTTMGGTHLDNFWAQPNCSMPVDSGYYGGDVITLKNPGAGLVCVVFYGPSSGPLTKADVTTFVGW